MQDSAYESMHKAVHTSQCIQSSAYKAVHTRCGQHVQLDGLATLDHVMFLNLHVGSGAARVRDDAGHVVQPALDLAGAGNVVGMNVRVDHEAQLREAINKLM